MITLNFYENGLDHKALLYHPFYISESLQNKLITQEAANVLFITLCREGIKSLITVCQILYSLG